MSTDRFLRVSEIFESVQGEGPSAGAESVFLRLATCNLRCTWCDTKYTWDWSRYRYEDEVQSLEVTDVVARVAASAARRLVVTGGEPLLQARALEALFDGLDARFHAEVETNGTLSPTERLAARVNQWNVSPKLQNSGEPLERRFVPAALASLLATGRAWLKLVVDTPGDAAEVDDLLEKTSWPRARVLLMPQAARRADLEGKGSWVRQIASARGVGVSPRLHVERWDGRRGV